MGTLLLLAVLLAFYVALGRSVQPTAERLPLPALGVRDLAAATALGFTTLNRLHAQRWHWDSLVGAVAADRPAPPRA